MKKLYLITLLLMVFAITATAQNKKMKIAVMDFKAGVGVNANEVEGLSDMLINTLYESGKFSIVERSQINQVLKEQKFQASELTNEQLAQVGRILGHQLLHGLVLFPAVGADIRIFQDPDEPGIELGRFDVFGRQTLRRAPGEEKNEKCQQRKGSFHVRSSPFFRTPRTRGRKQKNGAGVSKPQFHD